MKDFDLKQLKIGDEVCVAIIKRSNAARGKDMSIGNIDNFTYKSVVTKVGRKYITVEFNNRYGEEQFDIESGNNLYKYGSADYKLYLTKQDVIDDYKVDELFSLIKSKFGWSNTFALDQLERIVKIVEE